MMRAVTMTLGAGAVAACSGVGMLNSLAPQSGYQPRLNIPFDAPHQLSLDVYTPNGAAGAPVVVFFYGGRWQKGNKDQYQFVGASLARQGFVAVIPDYRKYPQASYPAFVQDCANAVAWVHRRIGSYGGSPQRIVIMGYDAGAYNAAMLALDPEFMKRAGGDRSWLRGMIGIAGPYDFLPIVAPDLRDIFGSPVNYPKTQPVFYADGTNPPLLLIAGDNDKVVSVHDTKTLYDRVSRANGPVEKVIYPNAPHERFLTWLSSQFSGQSDLMAHIVNFVRRVIQQPARPAAQPATEQGITTYPSPPMS